MRCPHCFNGTYTDASGWAPGQRPKAWAELCTHCNGTGYMRLYTIGTHPNPDGNDLESDVRIYRTGAYRTGNFPPLFRTRAQAEAYQAKKRLLNGVIVTLVVAPEPEAR